jgi:hypothetical protein
MEVSNTSQNSRRNMAAQTRVSQSHPEDFHLFRLLCCRGRVQVILWELSGDATLASWFDTVSSTYSYRLGESHPHILRGADPRNTALCYRSSSVSRLPGYMGGRLCWNKFDTNKPFSYTLLDTQANHRHQLKTFFGSQLPSHSALQTCRTTLKPTIQRTSE